MNASKSNFLERFSGRIGHITKNGQFQSQSTKNQDCSAQQDMHKINKYHAKRHSNTKLEKSVDKLKNQDKLVGYNIQNRHSSIQPNVARNEGMHPQIRNSFQEKENSKQKLISVGMNLIENNSGLKKKSMVQKHGSLKWQISDKDTNDFYQELTKVQLSKTMSYKK